MAGIFFTWSNAVTPGIGKLNDMGYLQSLQSMNRVILNTSFRIVFIGAIVAVAIIPVLYYKIVSEYQFWIFVVVFIIYWVGVFGVTFFGNIPLNRLLDNTNLESISTEHAKILRTTIETKWNSLNLVRTIASGVSFILLILSIVFLDR